MSEDPSHGEIQELLGAYALGAVDEGERTLVEAHLETCESCRLELGEHSRLAETLRRHASRASPLASAESNGGPKTIPRRRPARLGRGWRFRSAVAIVIVLLGGIFTGTQIRLNDLNAAVDRVEVLGRAQLATVDPAAVVTTLRTPRDEPVLTVVSRPSGGATYAVNASLPRLGKGRTYQLWRVDARGPSAAVALGPRPGAAAFSLPAGTTGFILTVEERPAPGHPTLPAIAAGQVSR